MGALCTEVAGVLEAVATAEDDEDEEPGASPATAPTRFALAVKASREAAADAGLAAPTTCAPAGCSPCDQSCINPARVLQSTPCARGESLPHTPGPGLAAACLLRLGCKTYYILP